MKIYTEDIYLLWFILTLLFSAWRLFNALVLTLRYPVFSSWFTAIAIGYGVYLTACFFFVFSYRKIFVDPITDISKKLECKIFYEKDKAGLTDIAREIAEDLGIRTPELLVTNKTDNALFCTGKDKDNSAVVISRAVLRNFSLDEISSMLAHELSHVKMFLRHKMHEVLTRAYLFRKVTLAAVVIMVPFELFVIFVDLGMFDVAWQSMSWASIEELNYWIWLHTQYYIEPAFTMLLLLCFFLGTAYYSLRKNKSFAIVYSEDTSEFLADAYSSFFFNNARTLKNAVEKFRKYMAQRIFSSLESSLFFVKDRKAQEGKQWQDVLHEKLSLREKSEYSFVIRMKALSFLDNMLNGKVKLRIVKNVTSRLASLRLYRGFALLLIWNYIFSVNDVKKKNVKKVLEYVSEHQESFDINDCAKELAIPRFHVFLILSMLIANQVVEVTIQS